MLTSDGSLHKHLFLAVPAAGGAAASVPSICHNYHIYTCTYWHTIWYKQHHLLLSHPLVGLAASRPVKLLVI
jgi:hypothetical protein